MHLKHPPFIQIGRVGLVEVVTTTRIQTKLILPLYMHTSPCGLTTIARPN